MEELRLEVLLEVERTGDTVVEVNEVPLPAQARSRGRAAGRRDSAGGTCSPAAA
jgi:hypothetical protein